MVYNPLLCRIVDMDFREHLFQALECIKGIIPPLAAQT
jgi:hypothetical protein